MAGGEAGGAAQDPETEAVQRAKSLLAEMKWITGNEVCTPYDPTRGCDTAEPPGGMLQRNYWVTGEGVQHVGIALMGAAPLNEVWHTLHSMTNLYEPVTVPTSGK